MSSSLLTICLIQMMAPLMEAIATTVQGSNRGLLESPTMCHQIC
ncbi:hypothetical protein [Trichocoleus sp. DQ-U1]